MSQLDARASSDAAPLLAMCIHLLFALTWTGPAILVDDKDTKQFNGPHAKAL